MWGISEDMTTESGSNSSYYGWLRSDILDAVPASACAVLSVGCGSGRTEAALVEMGKCVLGVEKSPEAAATARLGGVEVIEGDAAEVVQLLNNRTFDCLIYADVLEHIPTPEKVLAAHIRHLSPGGTIVISVPNFRHWSVAWALFVRGEFTYQSSGIFDHTHVRITTRKSVERWMSELKMQSIQVKHTMYRRRYRFLSAVTLGLFKEFLAYQILVVAKRFP